MYFRNPLKLIPVTQIGSVADSLTRNAIVSSNEFRPLLGLKQSSDPKADELSNKNLNPSNESNPKSSEDTHSIIPKEESQNGEL